MREQTHYSYTEFQIATCTLCAIQDINKYVKNNSKTYKKY